LLHLDFGKQHISFAQFAGLDRLLGIGFQARNSWIIAGLSRHARLKRFEPLGDLNELGSQSLWRNIRLPENLKRRANLALVEVEVVSNRAISFF
jgi:hypothetical protein